jgi:hypothetical protein
MNFGTLLFTLFAAMLALNFVRYGSVNGGRVRRSVYNRKVKLILLSFDDFDMPEIYTPFIYVKKGEKDARANQTSRGEAAKLRNRPVRSAPPRGRILPLPTSVASFSPPLPLPRSTRRFQ